MSAAAAAAAAARSQAAFFAEQNATTMTPADRARAAAAPAARPSTAAAAPAARVPTEDRFRAYAEADVREARAAQKAVPSTVDQMRREQAEAAARAESVRAARAAEKAAAAKMLQAAAEKAAQTGAHASFVGGPQLTTSPTSRATMNLAGLDARYTARDEPHNWLRDVALPREGPATTNPIVTNLPWGQGLTEERIVLDSWAASRRDPANGQWAFTISPQQYDNRSAGARLDLENIDQISVQQFSMPLPLPVPYVQNSIATADSGLPVLTSNGGAWTYTPYDQLMSLRRLYVRIRELDVMGYWGRSQRRWHFAFDVTPANTLSDSSDATPNCIRLTPTLDGKTIMFTTPIQQLPQITLEFMSPDAPVGFNSDTAGLTFSAPGGAGTPIIFTMSTASNLLAGDHVYFEDVAFQIITPTGPVPPTPYMTKVQNYLNAGPPGRVVGTGPTSTTFQLNPTIISEDSPADFTQKTAAQLYIVKNRFLMPLVFRGVRTTPTNAILRAPRP